MEQLATSYQKEVAASVGAVERVVTWVDKIAQKHTSLPKASVNAMVVCVQELLANVALHGTRPDGVARMRVGLEIAAKEIFVRIEDNGDAFDPTNDIPEVIDTDLASAQVGGRGVRIVRHMSRSMSYVRTGEWNCIQLDIA
jgi:anti-sigma regulatory factor (Ser/Thr protein kinase)